MEWQSRAKEPMNPKGGEGCASSYPIPVPPCRKHFGVDGAFRAVLGAWKVGPAAAHSRRKRGDYASYAIKLLVYILLFIHLRVHQHPILYCGVSYYATNILVLNHETGCRLSQKATRWAMRLCFAHDQTTTVWAFWWYVCRCVYGWCMRLVALVWWCIWGAARL